MEIQVRKFPLSPELIERVPLDERTFFLMLAHITNELNILRKIILISDVYRPSNKIEREAQAIQSLLLIKLFALKACAAFEFISKQAKQSFTKYYGQDSDSGFSNALKKLKRYFDGNSLLEYVRNKFGAHYDVNEVKEFAKKPINQTRYFYLTEQQGNSVYLAAEEMVFEFLISRANKGEDVKDVMGRLIDDVHRVVSLITDLAQGVFIVIGNRYAKTDWVIEKLEAEDVRLTDIRDVKLPFFVDFAPMLDD